VICAVEVAEVQVREARGALHADWAALPWN
jgi:hypothetical protein